MHYYRFNIADYRKDTMHLSRLEHGIYRDLIDWYYLEETQIPKETQSVMRRLRLGSDDEKTALLNVLSDFFQETDTGFCHSRIELDIAEYHEQCDKNAENGKKGGRPKGKKTQSVSSRLPVASQSEPTGNPNERQPLTTNQKPLTTNQSLNTNSVEPQSDSQLVISLKLIDKTDFNVTEDMLRDWQETFPAVDVMQELREMRNWCNVNAQKRKTRNGIAKFVSSWLGKQQDRGGQAPRRESALETPYQRSMRLRMQEAVPQIAAVAPSIPAGDFFRTIEMVEVVR